MRVAFVSFATPNERLARRVVEFLESHGVKCFFAPRDISVGSRWQGSLADAIANCSLLVLLLSRHAHDSEHVLREVDLAVERRLRVFPLQLDDSSKATALDYLLRPFQRLRTSRGLARKDLDALHDAIRRDLDTADDSHSPVAPTTQVTGASLYRLLLTANSPHQLQELAERVNLALEDAPQDLELRMLRRQVERAMVAALPMSPPAPIRSQRYGAALTLSFLLLVGAGTTWRVLNDDAGKDDALTSSSPAQQSPPMPNTSAPAAKPLPLPSPVNAAPDSAPRSRSSPAPAPTQREPPIAARRTPAQAAPAAAASDPGSARASAAAPEARCGGRNPMSYFVCMERECLRPEFTRHPDCLKWRKDAMRE